MGQVAITYKIMPEGIDVDLHLLKEEIKKIANEKIKVQVEEKPFAFGLKIIFATFVMDDKNPINVEEKLAKIKGIQSVETTSVGLL